jgi:trehalose synthase-fused probable maltokinase
VERWRDRIARQAERTFDLMEAQHARWETPAAAIARSLAGARATILERLRGGAGAPIENCQRIRIHGDFHLGQTLKTADGFVVIDFEGEPTKPLSERRQKQCALRDVAGLLRSIDYARASVGLESSDAVQSLRTAYLEGYRSKAATIGARFVPPAASFDAWLFLFELEKALYEVEYEANNRPGWVHIPLAAVRRLLTAGTRE